MKQPLTILPLLRAEKDGAEIFVNLPLRALSREREQKKSAARSFLKQHQNDAVDNACKRAEDDDRPCDDEHFCRHAGDEALCLCQDRDEGNFCPILLGFWLLKFLKKSAFFAKLL